MLCLASWGDKELVLIVFYMTACYGFLELKQNFFAPLEVALLYEMFVIILLLILNFKAKLMHLFLFSDFCLGSYVKLAWSSCCFANADQKLPPHPHWPCFSMSSLKGGLQF